MEIPEVQRENWGSRGGFILAAVGSAVGLGNLWGFPYKLYSSGGGAFLVPYVIAMFCIGIPLLILEFSLGHFTQQAAPDAFARTHKRHECVGWWGLILGFVIVTYYPAILAYCFSYLWISIKAIALGTALPWAGEGMEGVQKASAFFFEDYLKGGPQAGPFQRDILFTLFLSWVVMYFCIFRGVKLVGKIVWLTVSLPWILLLILAVRGLTLEGSIQGLVFYLDPDWAQLSKPTTWRFAFGQVFFSLSLAFGVMLTYASFLHRKSDINNNAAIIGIADLATSFIAGIAIFTTLGGMAYITAQEGNPVPVDQIVNAGPGLAFVAFPYALAQLPGAAWWSLIFFFTLVTLGIDSAFSITESVLAGIVDKTGWRRDIVLPAMSLVGLLAGLIFVTGNGLGWLGRMHDFINGTWGIAFIGLLECVVLGWLYRVDVLRRHANERSDWKLGRWWNGLIRILIPVVLGTLFFWSLYDDFSGFSTGQFLRDTDGKWIIIDCVGLGVVSIAGLLAIGMSLIKSPRLPAGEDAALQRKPHTAGRSVGLTALVTVVLSGVMLAMCVAMQDADDWVFWMLTGCGFGFGTIGLMLANWAMDRYSHGDVYPSRLVRLAGIASVAVISICLTLILNWLTGLVDKPQTVTHGEHLSGTSYVILGVVGVLIICGLGWCFWRAVTASSLRMPEEVQEDES